MSHCDIGGRSSESQSLSRSCSFTSRPVIYYYYYLVLKLVIMNIENIMSWLVGQQTQFTLFFQISLRFLRVFFVYFVVVYI